MPRFTGLSVAFALALSTGASVLHAEPAPSDAPTLRDSLSPSADRGRRLAEMKCASCHAIGPEGESPRTAAPPFRELHRRYNVLMLEEAFAEGIYVGHPEMPEFVLEPHEISELTAYLRSLERKTGDR